MPDWDPTNYLRFEAERTRPVKELVDRVLSPHAKVITDLGCGPGNSTAVLCKTWPKAAVTGIDSSLAMLEKARAVLPGCHFYNEDITRWQPDVKQDLILANASLQWVGGHERLFPRLLSYLTSQGVFAVQMPDNWHEPSHRLMRETARALGYSEAERAPLLSPENYYDLLRAEGCEVDIWRTTYFHILPSIQSIIDWLSTTGLRRFIHTLTPEQQAAWLQHYASLLETQYPVRQDGTIIMPYPRLFIVARKRI